MLFGDKKVFGIEFEVKELYHNKSFIGDGFFVVYIDGFMYGIREDDASSFGAILWTLKESCSSFIHMKNPFNNFEDFEICDKFYDANYRSENRYPEKTKMDYDCTYLVKPGCDERDGNLANRFLIYWAQMEEAFDDGSFILQINEEKYIRILGFKASANYDVENVHSAKVPIEDFFSTLQSVITELERYADM